MAKQGKRGFRCHTWLDRRGVLDAVRQASVPPLARAAALVEREAKGSMKRGGGRRGTPSAPGEPPHAQSGNLRGSIGYGRTPRFTYVVGPTLQAWYGQIHEFGGRNHPARPFMRPALWRVRGRFPALFRFMRLSSTRAGRRLNSRRGPKR